MAGVNETIIDPRQLAVMQRAKNMLARGIISEDAYNQIVSQFSPIVQISRPMGNADPDIDTTKVGPDRSLAENQRTQDRWQSNAMAIQDANSWRFPVRGGQ